MAIWVYGRIKEKSIDENLLEKSIIKYFDLKNHIIKKRNGKCVTYEGIGSENETDILFINEKKSPYNVYDSNITNQEFKYIQLIIFETEKEKISVHSYKEIICFCIYLRERIDSDILVTSDAHDEICLLKEKEIIWSKDLSYDYSKIIE